MSRSLGERTVAGDDRRVKRLCESDVHGVVCRDVVSQLPRATHEIEMAVAMKIEVGEIRNGVVGAPRRHFTGSHEASEVQYYLARKGKDCASFALATMSRHRPR